MAHKTERYIVEHAHQLYEGGPVENAVVSYNTALDGCGVSGGVTALSMAIHTAMRYKGVIMDDAGRMVRDFRPKTDKRAESRVS